MYIYSDTRVGDKTGMKLHTYKFFISRTCYVVTVLNPLHAL